MKRNRTRFTSFLVVSLAGIAAPAADAAEVVTTQVVGYQETPATISTGSSASFMARISDDGTSIEYELNYGLLLS